MKVNITFPLNKLFKDNPIKDNFWVDLLQAFVARSVSEDWPLPYRPVHLIGELQAFFKTNSIFELLQDDKEDICLVLQERPGYSMSTFQVVIGTDVMVPKSYWFIQRTVKPAVWKSDSPVKTGTWDSRLPMDFSHLQNTHVFAWPADDGSLCLWTDTKQVDGVVHLVEKFKVPERGLTPTPMNFNF